jgi:hypothetical protein
LREILLWSRSCQAKFGKSEIGQVSQDAPFVIPSLLAIIVALGPHAAENLDTLRRQIWLQALPRHERDVLAFCIGTDRVGRIVKRQAGAFACFGRWRERHRADLEQFGFEIFVPLRRRGIAGVGFLLFDIQRAEVLPRL